MIVKNTADRPPKSKPARTTISAYTKVLLSLLMPETAKIQTVMSSQMSKRNAALTCRTRPRRARSNSPAKATVITAPLSSVN